MGSGLGVRSCSLLCPVRSALCYLFECCVRDVLEQQKHNTDDVRLEMGSERCKSTNGHQKALGSNGTIISERSWTSCATCINTALCMMALQVHWSATEEIARCDPPRFEFSDLGERATPDPCHAFVKISL